MQRKRGRLVEGQAKTPRDQVVGHMFKIGGKFALSQRLETVKKAQHDSAEVQLEQVKKSVLRTAEPVSGQLVEK